MSIFFFKKVFLAAAVFLLLSCITVLLWLNQHKCKQEQIINGAETFAAQVKIQIEDFMNVRMSSVKIFVLRCVEREPQDFSKKHFFRFANTYFGSFPGFSQINFIDENKRLLWTCRNKNTSDKKMKQYYNYNDPVYRKALEYADKNLKYSLTPCIREGEKSIIFNSFHPIIYEDKIIGYLNCVFEVSPIIKLCLKNNIFNNFSIKIYEDNLLVFASESNEIKKNINKFVINAVSKIHFYGKTWEVFAEPAWINSQASVSNMLFLLFGIMLCFILAMLFYLFMSRMERYKKARDSTANEIIERKQVEKALIESEEKIKASVSELETFVYTVSHNLKTPIVTIYGFICALREDYGKDIPAEGHRYIKYISSAAKKMDAMITELIQLSRVGYVVEQKQKMPFASIINETIKMLRLHLDKKNIKVNVQKDLPTIFCDRKSMLQIMENLFLNSIKYIGEDNTEPQIDVGIINNKGENVFFVKDNGIGIDEKHFKKIFQPFQRLLSAKKIGEGTGIGLAIVKKNIENQGGSIWLTSEPGRGATFFFTLNSSK